MNNKESFFSKNKILSIIASYLSIEHKSYYISTINYLVNPNWGIYSYRKDPLLVFLSKGLFNGLLNFLVKIIQLMAFAPNLVLVNFLPQQIAISASYFICMFCLYYVVTKTDYLKKYLDIPIKILSSFCVGTASMFTIISLDALVNNRFMVIKSFWSKFNAILNSYTYSTEGLWYMSPLLGMSTLIINYFIFRAIDYILSKTYYSGQINNQAQADASVSNQRAMTQETNAQTQAGNNAADVNNSQASDATHQGAAHQDAARQDTTQDVASNNNINQPAQEKKSWADFFKDKFNSGLGDLSL